MLKTTERFISESREINGNKYSYLKCIYTGAMRPVCITCPVHGDFWQTPNAHLSHRQGCPVCGLLKRSAVRRKDTVWLIEKANKIHSGKYSYEKSAYTKNHNKICITCPIHGDFWQRASHHLSGVGCPKCGDSRGENLVRRWLLDNGFKESSGFIQEYSTRFCADKRPLKFDFFVRSAGLLIEYNGRQHYEPLNTYHRGGYMGFLRLKHHEWLKRRFARESGLIIVFLKPEDSVPDILSSYLQPLSAGS